MDLLQDQRFIKFHINYNSNLEHQFEKRIIMSQNFDEKTNSIQILWHTDSKKAKLKSLTRIERSILSVLMLSYCFSIGKCRDFSKNFIKNGNFSQPVVWSRYESFKYSIPGWQCSQLCQIKNCTQGRNFWLTLNLIDSDCIGQVIDLNSEFFNENVSQKIDITAGKYLIHFNYYYPIYGSRAKKLKVTFNGKTILYEQPLVDSSFLGFQYQGEVQSIQGINSLVFSNLGYSADGIGFKINNVSLYKINDESIEQFLKIFSEDSSQLNSLPGARIIFQNTLSFLMNFDRLQLYIYHKRRYSYHSQLLLLSINDFLSVKSDLAVKILSTMKDKLINQQTQFARQIHLKKSYIYYPSFSDQYQHVSYLQNLNSSFTFFFPFVLFLFISFNIVFYILFHRPISIIFRKYTLWAILFIMTFDGNIENLTFFTISYLQILFSTNFSSKIFNWLVIMLFFLLITLVFAFFLLAKFHYRKKTKYLIEQQNSSQQIIWGIAIDRGILCFLFGTIHVSLINHPNLQMLALICVECLWIIKKIIYVHKNWTSQKYMTMISNLSGFCRIIFQITCLVYQSQPDKSMYIDELHKILIFFIIGVAFLQFLIGLFYFIELIIQMITMKLKTNNKITNYQSKKISVNYSLINNKNQNSPQKPIFKKLKRLQNTGKKQKMKIVRSVKFNIDKIKKQIK